MQTRIVQVGLGPVGQNIVRAAVDRGFTIVAAADPAPDKTGHDLGEVCGLPELGLKVQPSFGEALEGIEWADAAVVSTVSSLRALAPMLEEIAGAGLHIVSTCEELVFPWKTHPRTAHRLDDVCRDKGVACLGTGVNPGFLMDVLPTMMTAVSRHVDAVRVWRIQDASVRRVPFQKKIGAGLSPERFRERQRKGAFGHVGLPESMDLIAHCLGWEFESRTETLDPVIAELPVTSGYVPIEAGMVRGAEQIGRGFAGGREAITLAFRAAVGEPESYERIRIDGDPPIDLRIEGGVNGDVATCAIVLNAVRLLLSSPPGLRTMADIPPVSWSATGTGRAAWTEDYS